MHRYTLWRPPLSEKPWCGQMQGQELFLPDPLSAPPVPLCGLSACMHLLLLRSVSKSSWSQCDECAPCLSYPELLKSGLVFSDTVLLILVYEKFSLMLFRFPFSSSNLPKGRGK